MLPTSPRAAWLLLAACLSCLSACAEKAAPTTSPNIILISIDSLRPDHLGCYGYPESTSPRIDRLAASGTRFSNALSSTSWTLPAHAGLFTGLADLSHGVIGDRRKLGDSHVTLAESLNAAGYQTAGFYGAPYLHPSFGLGQGFAVYEGYLESLWEDLPETEFRSQLAQGRLATTEQVTGPRMLAAVRAWLEGSDSRPAFLFLHAWDVHFDYIPPDQYVEMFDPGYEGSLNVEHLMRNPDIHAQMKALDLEHLLARYDGEIRFTDDILNEVFEALASKGILDNAIVVVTADHGEEFFEHGDKAHRRTLYDEVVRVPMIIAWPGKLPAGLVASEQVQLIDLLPTLLSLAGVPLSGPVHGRDLSPLLRGGSLGEVDALLQLGESTRALRAHDRKLVIQREGRPEFYDLVADPGEHNPLPTKGKDYQDALQRLQRLIQRARDSRDAIAPEIEEIELDAAMRERLEALGYIDPAEAATP